MKDILSIIKIVIVFTFVAIGIIFSFKGQCNESLNGIIAGIALIESFVIGNYELSKREK